MIINTTESYYYFNWGENFVSQMFTSGDFLVFQLESGFALLRLLAVDESHAGKIWHLATYSDFFPDVETSETATANPAGLQASNPHIALTNRAFESTQVARIANVPLTMVEKELLMNWRADPTRQVSDRSVRLMLGIR